MICNKFQIGPDAFSTRIILDPNTSIHYLENKKIKAFTIETSFGWRDIND